VPRDPRGVRTVATAELAWSGEHTGVARVPKVRSQEAAAAVGFTERKAEFHARGQVQFKIRGATFHLLSPWALLSLQGLHG
jgi:hypothetical protein